MERVKLRTSFVLWLLSLLLVAALVATATFNVRAGEEAGFPGCLFPGWFPKDFGLKDHTIFWHDGYYYLLSTYVPADNPAPLVQDRFVYARSSDLCNWEELDPVFSERIPGTWDETAIWAPYVFEEEGMFYLFYTGVMKDSTQSILLAKSTDPADPASWQKEALVFQPNHASAVWEAGMPSDCRDPFVMKQDDQYYLYYTGQDTSGGIIGIATAASPEGPWVDWGSIVNPLPGEMYESPTVAQYDRYYYLFYNLPFTSEYYRIGSSPVGAWSFPEVFTPGWAHEIWRTPNGKWMASYLTNYTVTIAHVVWNDYNNVPPRPTIEGFFNEIYLPLVSK